MWPRSAAGASASGLAGAAHGLPGAPRKIPGAGRRLPGGSALLHLPDVDDDGDGGELHSDVFQCGGGVPCMQLAGNSRAEPAVGHLQHLLVVLGRGARPDPHVRSRCNAVSEPFVCMWS